MLERHGRLNYLLHSQPLGLFSQAAGCSVRRGVRRIKTIKSNPRWTLVSTSKTGDDATNRCSFGCEKGQICKRSSVPQRRRDTK